MDRKDGGAAPRRLRGLSSSPRGGGSGTSGRANIDVCSPPYLEGGGPVPRQLVKPAGWWRAPGVVRGVFWRTTIILLTTRAIRSARGQILRTDAPNSRVGSCCP